jgi:hypothetical protein
VNAAGTPTTPCRRPAARRSPRSGCRARRSRRRPGWTRSRRPGRRWPGRRRPGRPRRRRRWRPRPARTARSGRPGPGGEHMASSARPPPGPGRRSSAPSRPAGPARRARTGRPGPPGRRSRAPPPRRGRGVRRDGAGSGDRRRCCRGHLEGGAQLRRDGLQGGLHLLVRDAQLVDATPSNCSGQVPQGGVAFRPDPVQDGLTTAVGSSSSHPGAGSRRRRSPVAPRRSKRVSKDGAARGDIGSMMVPVCPRAPN